ncbi:MAG: ribonuclease HII [Erysipelotrichaceae bacterium]|nr:ribonuclease HII [Erysipelotrichaceae bacterium]
MNNMREFEQYYIDQGYQVIAGCDEAGRGPIAGPVVIATVILPNDFNDQRINDSKKISEKKREMLYDVIIENALDYQVIVYDEKIIDKINIYQASKKGMEEGIEKLLLRPDFVLTDAMKLDERFNHLPIIKGDARSISIAAASILAKVSRDRIMKAYDQQYPQYGFASHKGYPTKQHKEALEKYGVLPIHRKTFEPVKSMCLKQMTFDF